MVASLVFRTLTMTAFVAVAAVACSALVDTSGLSGGGDVDGSAPSGGEAAAPPPPPPGSDDGSSDGASIDVATDGDAAPLDYRATVLSDGPVAYYRLADPSGTVAKDETLQYPGTYVGSVQLGQPGPGASSSARFASGAHMNADAVAKLPLGSFVAWTVEGWISSEVPAGVSGFVWAFSASAGGGGPLMFVDDGTQKIRANIKGAVLDSTVALPVGTWHHFALACAGGAADLYVDGKLDGSIATPSPTPDRTFLTIAGDMQSADGGPVFGGQYTGRIADLAIYAKVLTAERVAAHYAAKP